MFKKFFNAIGLGKGPKDIPVTIDGSSQTGALNLRMEKQGFTHDQTALVDLKNIRVRGEHGTPVMYFCCMEPIVIHEQISEGDGKPVPCGLELENIRIPKHLFEKAGMFNLRRVKLYSNGTMQIIATSGTVFEPVG